MITAALDIGVGTQDILIYDANEILDNCIKLIYPSPTKQIAKYIDCLDRDIFINGGIVGGGPLVKALYRHKEKGYNVFISKSAACTIRDDIDVVKNDGFIVVDYVESPDITLKEINFDLIRYLSPNVDRFLIAAQDHGFIKGNSDRVTRITFLKEFLSSGLKDAFFTKQKTPPAHFTRWQNIYNELVNENINDFVISDTAVAASLGALYQTARYPSITIDVGNGHTFAALVDEGYNVISFFEHHTSMLTTDKIWELLDRLKDCTITFEEIYNAGGHGAYCFKNRKVIGDIPILVTGPKRAQVFTSSDPVVFSAPAGDHMITGPIGLLIQQSLL